MDYQKIFNLIVTAIDSSDKPAINGAFLIAKRYGMSHETVLDMLIEYSESISEA